VPTDLENPWHRRNRMYKALSFHTTLKDLFMELVDKEKMKNPHAHPLATVYHVQGQMMINCNCISQVYYAAEPQSAVPNSVDMCEKVTIDSTLSWPNPVTNDCCSCVRKMRTLLRLALHKLLLSLHFIGTNCLAGKQCISLLWVK